MLAEELDAEPVWVLNNGVAHVESLPTSQIEAWVQDALDGIEYISGGLDTKFGAVRGAMGHPEPWRINFVAIGNEAGFDSPACQ